MPLSSGDVFDELTLTLEHCDVLTDYLIAQLDDLAEEADEPRQRALYALRLLTEHLREKQRQVRQHADALNDQALTGTA